MQISPFFARIEMESKKQSEKKSCAEGHEIAARLAMAGWGLFCAIVLRDMKKVQCASTV